MRAILHLPRAPGREPEPTKHDQSKTNISSGVRALDSKDTKPVHAEGVEPHPQARPW